MFTKQNIKAINFSLVAFLLYKAKLVDELTSYLCLGSNT